MKSNIKAILLMTGSVCTTIVICVVFGFFGKNEEDEIINRIVGIVAIISGLGSLLVGVSSILTASLDNVREYFATGEEPEIADARHVLYNYRNIKIRYGKTIYDEDFDRWVQENISADDAMFFVEGKEQVLKASSRVANFYQMWGLLQSRNFLPIWVFDTTSGYNMLKLYQSMLEIVDNKRQANPLYAAHFERLCERIGKKYDKVIRQCRDSERTMFITKYGVENIDDNHWFAFGF